MKIPPIYNLNDRHFNMNKLEHIGNVIEFKSNMSTTPEIKPSYWFTYQMNGYVYDSDYNEDRNIVEKERKALIKEWQIFWGGEL